MKLKKFLCLLLALLMVCSMVACGEDADGSNKDENGTNNQGGKDPANGTTAPTEPSLEELGPWIVTEEVDDFGFIYRYHYNENGELTSYELYLNNKKVRDYNATHSVTEEGGKLTRIESKHVEDSVFEIDSELEYDAKGNLISNTTYILGKASTIREYTYDDNGNLLTYRKYSNDRLAEEAEYTYDQGILMTVSAKKYESSDTYEYTYRYTYNKAGYLSQIDFDYSGVGQGTITLGKDISKTEGGLHVLTHSAHSMAYQNIISYEAELDAEGQRSKFAVSFRRWGFEPVFAFPLPAYGCLRSNWAEGNATITYTRLDVYLAQQGEK